jgi:hypothetical protein
MQDTKRNMSHGIVHQFVLLCVFCVRFVIVVKSEKSKKSQTLPLVEAYGQAKNIKGSMLIRPTGSLGSSRKGIFDLCFILFDTSFVSSFGAFLFVSFFTHVVRTPPPVCRTTNETKFVSQSPISARHSSLT